MSWSRQELQRVLRAALDRFLHPLEPLRREGLVDDEKLVVVELEDVRRQAAAHCVGLAQIPVDLEFHQSSVSVPLRRRRFSTTSTGANDWMCSQFRTRCILCTTGCGPAHT